MKLHDIASSLHVGFKRVLMLMQCSKHLLFSLRNLSMINISLDHLRQVFSKLAGFFFPVYKYSSFSIFLRFSTQKKIVSKIRSTKNTYFKIHSYQNSFKKIHNEILQSGQITPWLSYNFTKNLYFPLLLISLT